MLPSIEDVVTWPVEVICGSIRGNIPETWQFTMRLEEDGCWHAAFVVDGVAVWSDTSFVDRLLALSAMGWLIARQQKGVSALWRQPRARPTVTSARVVGVTAGTTPDPDDVDPTEVESFYKQRR